MNRQFDVEYRVLDDNDSSSLPEGRIFFISFKNENTQSIIKRVISNNCKIYSLIIILILLIGLTIAIFIPKSSATNEYKLQLQINCGKPSIEPNPEIAERYPRIINGRESIANSWP